METNRYKRITANGIRNTEHRIIMQKFLNRKLDPNEIIHHKNGDIKDNRIDNLELTTRKEHPKRHFDFNHYLNLGKLGGQAFKERHSLPHINNFYTCSKCRILKHGSEYSKDNRRWNKLDLYCKKCKGVIRENGRRK